MNERLQEKSNNIGILQEIYDERKDDVSVIEIFFPADMDYSLLLASLEQITANYGYELTSVNIVKATNASDSGIQGMELVDLQVRASGREENVTKLVKHLEELPVIPNVRSVAIDPDVSNDIDSWVDVKIDMYILKTT